MKDVAAPACTGMGPSACPRCGVLPHSLEGASPGLVLWPPAGHVRGRIQQIARRQGVALKLDATAGALSWEPSSADELAPLVSRLVDELSPVEREDVRVFLGEPSTFGLGSGREVVSLAAAHARLRSSWLLRILEEDRLRSWMQPIFRASDGALDGHEFLLRGVDAEGSMVSPGPMFDVARRADLLFQLDLAARRSAIRTAARHEVEGSIFINFTPNAVYDPAFCLRATVELVEEAGLTPDRVIFEITEGDHEHDTDHLRNILRFYRARGFRVALDDVGAGFASLNRIHELQPDIMKIDMALVRDADTDPFKRTLARKLVESAQELGIASVAEGIETEGERRLFAELGVTWLQGWYLGRPAAEPWSGAVGVREGAASVSAGPERAGHEDAGRGEMVPA